MQLNKRQIWIVAIVLLTLVIMTMFMAPRGGGSRLTQGSTYGRSPDGYGAWYAFMQERGTPVERWQKPLRLLLSDQDASKLTVLRISNGIERLGLTPNEQAWVKQGNVLVLLGTHARSTQAPFTSDLSSPQGEIRIETSRRQLNPDGQVWLKDSFGAVVWEQTIGQGKVIYASTPYLAANAYQDFRPNYEFLAKLVTDAKHPIWVDEYMHGYQDEGSSTPAEPKQGRSTPMTLLAYLAGTPVLLVIMQAIVFLVVLMWGLNRRLGPAIVVTPPTVNNSEAYIQALAGALYKAECSEFVLETVGKAEQLHIQTALGLGNTLLPLEAVVNAWVQQTGRPAAELEATLRMAKRQRRVSEAELSRWLNDIQAVRQHLPSQ